MRKSWRAVLLAATLLSTPALAEPGPVGVITGMPAGTYAATGWNLTTLDTPAMRVVVMLGKGSVQNLDDLLHLRGVDAAFVQGDVLAYARSHHLFPASELAQVQYIAKLYNEEVHIVARSSIASLGDLAGKRVNVDVVGSGSAMTAEMLLDTLHITADVSHRRQAEALEAMKKGEIDAIIHVGGAPIPFLKDAEIPAGSLHFLSIPLTDPLAETYLPAEITHAEYPALVPDAPIQTIAVADVLVAFGWQQNSPRYANVARLVDALYDHIGDLQRPPNHPKWREVSLSASAPGWVRFQAADAAVARIEQQRRFQAFAQNQGVSPDAAKVLFQKYQDCLRMRLAACQ
jgi:TRAP transporter TAXI family solute receptor